MGVGWGSGPLGAATRCPRRRRPFHFFFATWPFLAIRNVRVLGTRRTTDDETGLPPLNPLVLRTENRQNFGANFFFQKKIWRQNFFGDFKKLVNVQFLCWGVCQGVSVVCQRLQQERERLDTNKNPPPDLQSLVQDLQRQQQDLQRQLQDLQRRLAAAEEDAAKHRREAATEAAKLLGREDRPVAGQPPRSGGSSGAGQITAKETQPDACAGARARACVGACARACVERALERAPESAPERSPGTSRACPLPWPRKLLTTWV